MSGFRDPKFVVAYTIILGFAAAYVHRPDDTMNGALIAAFAGAWGFYLGSSNSSNHIREQMDKALDLGLANSPPPTQAAAGAQAAASAAQDVAEGLRP